MPRKQSSHKLKNEIAQCHQAPEHRLVHITESRIKDLRHASENQNVRETSLDPDKEQVNLSRKNDKKRVRSVNKKLLVKQSLSRIASFKSYLSRLDRRKFSGYKRHLKIKRKFKMSENTSVVQGRQELCHKKPHHLEKDCLQANASRTTKRVVKRIDHQPTNAKEISLQEATLHGEETKVIPHVTQIKSTTATPRTIMLLQSKQNVLNVFQPKFRAGLCPKSAGNYNLMM